MKHSSQNWINAIHYAISTLKIMFLYEVEQHSFMPTLVWGLYEKHPGEYGKLVGVFSSIDLAKSCALIQSLLQSDWQYRDVGKSYVWIAQALDADHYGQESFAFTIEEIEVDRLVEQPRQSP